VKAEFMKEFFINEKLDRRMKIDIKYYCRV